MLVSIYVYVQVYLYIEFVCVCVCVCECVRACVRACVCVCVYTGVRKRLHTLPSHPALGEPQGSGGGRPTKKDSQGLKEPWGRSSVNNDGDSAVCQD